MGIRILKGGLLTTIQDAGRRGFQRYGMAVSGSVDVHSYIYANILVGNEPTEAVLEVTLMGPSIEFTSPSVIAITGGDLTPRINGEPVRMYKALRVSKGDVLSFGHIKSGCRADIAFAGGLDIEETMGSRSTYIKAGLGGHHGRNLQDGDEVAFRKEGACPKNIEIREMDPPIDWTGNYTVRVVLGPEEDRFTDAGIGTFLSSEYKVTNSFDRMGVRLEGDVIEHVNDANVISNGIPFGAIQVPDSGQPIIMLSDRQTVGGYTKIATIINVDMPMIAQCKAGDKVHFKSINIYEAQELFVKQKNYYRALRDSFDNYVGKLGSIPESPLIHNNAVEQTRETVSQAARSVQKTSVSAQTAADNKTVQKGTFTANVNGKEFTITFN
ncbi:MAG: biotin-dependent carboxyltransferase family protein [Lachnospiraceae bacterium]|nr:biotin-dependent carboxyltransferase family protein [Lachnospiraceae bacterium]